MNDNFYLFDAYKTWDIKDLPTASGIYCFRNKINNKLYIGQAQNIRNRINHHLKSTDNLYFHNALRKYGKENFYIYILEFAEIEKLSDLEIYYINKFNSFKEGYNLSEGGEGRRGYHLSEEQKEIIRNSVSKETWAYNFKEHYFINAASAIELSNLIRNRGYSINMQNIYDAVHNKSYSKDFTFGFNKEEAYHTAQNIQLPKDLTLFLYNYKTETYSPMFKTIPDAEEYIKSCGYKLCCGHLSTAINNDNVRIKDFLFAFSKKELEEKIKKFPIYTYCYYIPENILFRFPYSDSGIYRKLKEMGYRANQTGVSAAKRGKQKQSNGFIIADSMELLLKRVYAYNINMTESVFKLAEDCGYLNTTDAINWLDELNQLSVKY